MNVILTAIVLYYCNIGKVDESIARGVTDDGITCYMILKK